MTRRLTRKQTIALAIVAGVLVAAVALAWSLDLLARGQDSEPYRVSVVRDEDVMKTYDIESLRAFGTRTVKMQGEVQEGPPLLDVLKAAGVDQFTSLTITGVGLKDSGRIVLKAEDVDQDVLLDFSNRGTVKVCGPRIAWEDRVRDVERIEVR